MRKKDGELQFNKEFPLDMPLSILPNVELYYLLNVFSASLDLPFVLPVNYFFN